MDTTTLQIRLANHDDIPALRDLEIHCFTTDRLTLAQLHHYIGSSSALVAVCEIHSRIIASAVVLFRKHASIARLYSLAVAPDNQGKGIAATLHAFIEKQAAARQCQRIRLEVRHDNHRAIDFYNRHGYVIAGEYKQFYEDGADAIKMVKQLTQTT